MEEKKNYLYSMGIGSFWNILRRHWRGGITRKEGIIMNIFFHCIETHNNLNPEHGDATAPQYGLPR